MSSRQAYWFCFCCRRMFKLKMAESPEEIVNLFNHYSDNGLITVEKLLTFLVEFQGEKNATIEDAQAIFSRLKRLHVFPRRGLHQDAFFRYLSSGDLNPPLPALGVHNDMNAPLAHYFMYTGHNSYLTGNQISSDSSIFPIIKALRSGVRVIELDLWPNSKKDDVQVLHGGTLTSSVGLIKCLEAIKENAFYASEYPVIITFEDHLNSSLQCKVAEMVTATFGDILFTSSDFQEFPSPESLKGKILISTKAPKESEDSLEKVRYSSDTSLPRESRSISKNEFDIQTKQNVKDEDEEENDEEEEEESLIPKYVNLIAIQAMKGKGGLNKLLKDDSNKVARLSLSEQELESVVKTLGTDIVRFTRRNFIRIYPKGSRILSSNYNPLIAWTHGAQMVAFNMQGYEKYLWVMHGMFKANGGCGYVKKPQILLNVGPNNEVFDPSSTGQPKITLKVKVYMGDGWHLDFKRTHFDRFSPPDFFTKLQIYGVPADRKKVKTEPLEDQWVPIWNKEFEFPLTAPEVALLRIEVREYDMTGKHDFGGQTCLPLSELRTGIRAIPLYDKKGDKYKHVKLLMRFHFIQH